MKISCKQYISNNRDRNSYTTIFKHSFDKSEKKVDKQGDIYAFLKISSEKSAPAERISKFVWDSIVDGYLYSTSATTNESLKEAIAKGVEKVRELIRHDKQLEETGIDVSFTIVLVKEEGLYIGVFGESDIYAFKKGTLVNISSILEEKKANTAGLALLKDDILMVSSKALLDGKEKILLRLKNKEEFVKVLEEVGSKLDGTEVLLHFAEELEEKKPQEENIPVVKKVGDGVGKIFAPRGRIEKIKKPAKQNTLQNLKDKIQLEEKVRKVKEFGEKIKVKISPFVLKIRDFLLEKWGSLKESVVKSFGRKKWYKRFASKWSEVRVGKSRSRGIQGMRIDGYKKKDLKNKRFKLLALFLIISVLLVLGVNFTIKMKEAREISNLAQESFVQIEGLLKKVGDNFVADRDSAETYLFQAEKALKEVPEDLNEKDNLRFVELKEKTLSLGDTLYKRVGVKEKDGALTSYIDSRLAFGEGSEVVDLTIYKDRLENEYLVAADLGRKSIYRVSLYDKSVRALPDEGGLIRKPKFVYVGEKGVYVYDETGGMLKATFDSEGWFSSFTSLSGLGTGDIRASDIAAMTVWTVSDNVYFLSRDRQAFLRSTAVYEDRYGLPYEYFTHERMDIATDMVADLSIYIIVPEDPHILRFNYSFFEGKYFEAPLGVVGFDGNYGKLTKAFTGGDLTSPLYVFDSEGKRFLLLQKPIESGEDVRHPNQVSLLNQYIYRGEKSSIWSDVKNFVVDEGGENIYILDGSEIWKLAL